MSPCPPTNCHQPLFQILASCISLKLTFKPNRTNVPNSGPSANASSGLANHFLGTSEPIGRTCLACPGLEQQPSCSGCEACCKQTSQCISQTGVGRSHFGPATGFAAFGKKLGIPEKWTKVQMARNFPELPVSERRRQSQNAQQDVKMACFTTFE